MKAATISLAKKPFGTIKERASKSSWLTLGMLIRFGKKAVTKKKSFSCFESETYFASESRFALVCEY